MFGGSGYNGNRGHFRQNGEFGNSKTNKKEELGVGENELEVWDTKQQGGQQAMSLHALAIP